MAVTLEQVEQLRARTDLSYEEARDVLTQCGGSLLDALILLERRGRTKQPGAGGFYTTRPGGEAPEATDLVLTKPPQDGERPHWTARLWAFTKELLLAALSLLQHSMSNHLEIWRKGDRLTSLPVLILIILVIAAFWIVVPVLIMGLFFGCQYRFAGPDLNRETIDAAMRRCSDAVHDIVDQVRDSINRRARREKK